MDVEKYIASGILELYVAGLLSDSENLEVARAMEEYPKIRQEVEEIEAAITRLSTLSTNGKPAAFSSIRESIENKSTVLETPIVKRRIDWFRYAGWAAMLVVGAGLWYQYYQNQQLDAQLKVVEGELIQLEEQIANARASEQLTEGLLNTLRDKNITVVPLQGQERSPESFARVYWNKQEQKLLVDAQGLPLPPEGMAYQVWSLTLDPLTPTSIGLLKDFVADENKIFELLNPNASEAFGITLEPEGGSESPTLEQLFTLGTVAG